MSESTLAHELKNLVDGGRRHYDLIGHELILGKRQCLRKGIVENGLDVVVGRGDGCDVVELLEGNRAEGVVVVAMAVVLVVRMVVVAVENSGSSHLGDQSKNSCFHVDI